MRSVFKAFESISIATICIAIIVLCAGAYRFRHSLPQRPVIESPVYQCNGDHLGGVTVTFIPKPYGQWPKKYEEYSWLICESPEYYDLPKEAREITMIVSKCGFYSERVGIPFYGAAFRQSIVLKKIGRVARP